jgi:hypothetical protein
LASFLSDGRNVRLAYAITRNLSSCFCINALSTDICSKQKNTQKSNKQLQTSWNEECTNAFEVMKEHLTSSPVLGYADYTATANNSNFAEL